mmetsp:Transcript_33038/g.67864  ORF Transcript_33038/g.67864 Transcript_33038/m.67864 type:complete len:215 (-) Transcript_33038:681-1325(-)
MGADRSNRRGVRVVFGGERIYPGMGHFGREERGGHPPHPVLSRRAREGSRGWQRRRPVRGIFCRQSANGSHTHGKGTRSSEHPPPALVRSKGRISRNNLRRSQGFLQKGSSDATLSSRSVLSQWDHRGWIRETSISQSRGLWRRAVGTSLWRGQHMDFDRKASRRSFEYVSNLLRNEWEEGAIVGIGRYIHRIEGTYPLLCRSVSARSRRRRTH